MKLKKLTIQEWIEFAEAIELETNDEAVYETDLVAVEPLKKYLKKIKMNNLGERELEDLIKLL